MEVHPVLSELRRRGHAKIEATPAKDDVTLARDESEEQDGARAPKHLDSPEHQSSDAPPRAELKRSRVFVATLVVATIAIFVAWAVRFAHDVFVTTIVKLVELANYDITDTALSRAAFDAVEGLKTLPNLYLFKF
jgi:hypothetical protein